MMNLKEIRKGFNGTYRAVNLTHKTFRFLSDRKGLNSTETWKIPSRATIIQELKSNNEYDVLIIGGGATGAGAALDACTRGLKVACVEREDFSC